jgi:hypothetical protein
MAVNAGRIRRVVGYLLSLAVIFFLARTLFLTWNELTTSGIRFALDLVRLTASLAALLVGGLLAVASWRQVVLGLGQRLSVATALRAWFLSNLTRYIPGNVWQVASMVVILERAGISKGVALLSQVVYLMVALSIAGLLGLTFLVARPDLLASAGPLTWLRSLPFLLGASVLVLGALVVLLSTPLFYRLASGLTGRLTRRQFAPPVPGLARGVLPPLLSVSSWFVNGMAFYIFMSALVDVPLDWLLPVVLINAGAYFVGYVSFVTPSGLGFREGAMALMLSAYFPTPVAVALALVTRLWSTAGELLGAALVYWFCRPEEGGMASEAPSSEGRSTGSSA